MRFPSYDPIYLDQLGIGGVWREGLGGLKVLRGLTKGYKNHPQLTRFKKCPTPINSFKYYLAVVANNAKLRGYHYDTSKIKPIVVKPVEMIPVTTGQIKYEFDLLQKKLYAPLRSKKTGKIIRKHRDIGQYRKNRESVLKLGYIKIHPLFKKIKGDVEQWEIR